MSLYFHAVIALRIEYRELPEARRSPSSLSNIVLRYSAWCVHCCVGPTDRSYPVPYNCGVAGAFRLRCSAQCVAPESQRVPYDCGVVPSVSNVQLEGLGMVPSYDFWPILPSVSGTSQHSQASIFCQSFCLTDLLTGCVERCQKYSRETSKPCEIQLLI